MDSDLGQLSALNHHCYEGGNSERCNCAALTVACQAASAHITKKGGTMACICFALVYTFTAAIILAKRSLTMKVIQFVMLHAVEN